MFNGLSTVNIELTSRCDKGDGTPGSGCWMCGRRKIERDYPQLTNWGDMDFGLVQQLAQELPKGIVIQFHDNGEPLLYPYLGKALQLFEGSIRCFDTNGKTLMQKADEIIDNMESLTISVIEKDVSAEALNQHMQVKAFLARKGNHKPHIIVARCLGEVESWDYEALGCIIAKRVLHSPMGSFGYQKEPIKPEIGICLDLLHHLSIKRDGSVSICVRFDPEGKGILGNIKEMPLNAIWDGEKRRDYLNHHLRGERASLGLCQACNYWGVPTA